MGTTIPLNNGTGIYSKLFRGLTTSIQRRDWA